MRKVIRLRKMDPQTRREQEAMIETYETALDEAELRENAAPSRQPEETAVSAKDAPALRLRNAEAQE